MRAVALAVAVIAVVGCNKKKAVVVPPLPPVVINRTDVAPPPAPSKPPRKAATRVQQVEQAVTPPALEPMTTPEQKRNTSERLRVSMARAQSNWNILRGRQLGPDGARDLARVESFLRQARAAEEANDVITAYQYAQRAEVLSDDLMKR